MNRGNKLELLSPAKNLECGLAALQHGADAVYIGAQKFGAREAAGNDIADIERLVNAARIYGARVYVTLNTTLYDHELDEAQKLIWKIYEAGADALIIQDFGILEMDLPPIRLHASTQVNNYTREKVKFLKDVGFKRAVLARELSLDQIKQIASNTTIELEAFIHGSLCVSLSGQCYMSFAAGGRSANRGACAQPCRKRYTLRDATGKVIAKDKYLLSMKDLNRSDSLEELAEAGIRSFKIEGRLKDVDYVKNITASYRQKIDLILEQHPQWEAASHGKTHFLFLPDPAKSFSRGTTDYFLHGRQIGISGISAPKSKGELLGVVSGVWRDSFAIRTTNIISNNDGLTFEGKDGELCGIKVNKVQEERIFPDKMNGIFMGAMVYRNRDHLFQTAMLRNSAIRKIPVSVSLTETDDGFSLSAGALSFGIKMEKTTAREPMQSMENIRRQLGKSGETPFGIDAIDTGGNERYFFTAQQINELRRGLLLLMEENIKLENQPLPCEPPQPNTIPVPEEAIDFETNINNRLAAKFYRRHGCENPTPGIEIKNALVPVRVMITRHCLRHELGYCAKFGGTPDESLTYPYFLYEGSNRFEVRFDCKNCLMSLYNIM